MVGVPGSLGLAATSLHRSAPAEAATGDNRLEQGDISFFNSSVCPRKAHKASGCLPTRTAGVHFCLMSLAKGTRLGPYEIAALIGAGGMGEVFRARDTRLDREVAIKVLPKGFVADADRLRRFEQEAR